MIFNIITLISFHTNSRLISYSIIITSTLFARHKNVRRRCSFIERKRFFSRMRTILSDESYFKLIRLAGWINEDIMPATATTQATIKKNRIANYDLDTGATRPAIATRVIIFNIIGLISLQTEWIRVLFPIIIKIALDSHNEIARGGIPFIEVDCFLICIIAISFEECSFNFIWLTSKTYEYQLFRANSHTNAYNRANRTIPFILFYRSAKCLSNMKKKIV